MCNDRVGLGSAGCGRARRRSVTAPTRRTGVWRTLDAVALLAALGAAVSSSCKDPVHYACDASLEAIEPAQRAMRPSALVNGFRTNQFQLARDERATTFVATLPDSDLLSCALFVTNPAFDGNHARITNAATAIARFQVLSVTDMPAVSFTLSGFEHPDSETFKDCGATPAIYRVDGLSLGCWAMQGTRLVGASALIELSLAEVPQAQPAVDYCMTTNLADTAGRMCALDAQFGVCLDGSCETGILDAAVPESATVSACTKETPGEACVVSTSSELGRCRSGRCVREEGEEILADQLVVPCSDGTAITSEARNGYSCLQPELGAFGSCYLGRCRRRCEVNSDCRPTNGGEFLGPLGQEIVCDEPAANAGVQVCMRRDELR